MSYFSTFNQYFACRLKEVLIGVDESQLWLIMYSMLCGTLFTSSIFVITNCKFSLFSLTLGRFSASSVLSVYFCNFSLFIITVTLISRSPSLKNKSEAQHIATSWRSIIVVVRVLFIVRLTPTTCQLLLCHHFLSALFKVVRHSSLFIYYVLVVIANNNTLPGCVKVSGQHCNGYMWPKNLISKGG